MADNVTVTAGSGTTIAADDIAGVLHQRVKVSWGVDGSAVDASATNPFPISDPWRLSTLSFNTINSSNTTFTVPATTEYQVLSIYVELATTATVGNRLLAIHLTDSADVVIGRLRAGAVQAASLTRFYQWGRDLPQETAFRDTDYIAQAMMPIYLGAGQKLRIYDKAAVDAAADDMVIKVQISSRSIA